jgi:hypothetical protein
MKIVISLLIILLTPPLWAELTTLTQRSELALSVAHTASYTHKIDLDIYVLKGAILGPKWLQKHLNRAQKLLDKCGIRLDIQTSVALENGSDWLEWEDIEFNSGQFSEWERTFFTKVKDYSAGIIMTNTLNWSDDPELYHGIGYAPFLTRFLQLTPADLDFYNHKVSGHVVLSKHAGEWTLIHEIGHAVLNLEHVESDPTNIMFPYYKASHPTFSEWQCELAKQQIRVHPL